MANLENRYPKNVVFVSGVNDYSMEFKLLQITKEVRITYYYLNFKNKFLQVLFLEKKNTWKMLIPKIELNES